MYNSNGWNAALNGNNNDNNYYNRGYFGQLPRYELVKVNGEAGAKAFRMGPNSNTILADASNPNLLWLVQTDGAGYLTATPLDVQIHQDKPQPSIFDLDERIKRLEEMYEFNNRSSKQPKKQRQSNNAAANEPVDIAD